MAQHDDPRDAVKAHQSTLIGAVPAESRRQLREVEAQPTVPSQSSASQPNADPAATLGVGSIIGQRYIIERHISSGGFGAVYRAADREIVDHHVALKLLHYPSPSGPEREGALRELMLIATVSHPSVVQFKDYGWHENRLWFAMPWYQGRTLDSLVGNDENAVPMTRADARPLFERIAQGLAAMHAVGIHHHDIKPENIFVAEIAGFPGGLPILLDLGIATRRGENPKGLTVEYASPETAAAMLGVTEKPIGAAADVYSLALVLRNLLDPSTATPVRTAEVMPLLHQRSTIPVDLSKKRDLQYLEPYFQRWLSLDPDDRPNASELANQFAVLTAPEEQREARMRLLKRIVPIVVIAGLMIAALVFQVRRQKTALQIQNEQLQEERQLGESLRKQSESQLGEIEKQAKTLGNERQQLERTLGIARNLNQQLSQASRREDQLQRRAAKLTSERDAVLGEKATLTVERDAATAERNRLREDNSKLARARAELQKESDRLATQRDQAVAQREAMDKRIANMTKEQDKLTEEVRAQDAKLEKATQDRDEAVARVDKLEQQIEKLRADKQEPDEQITAPEVEPAAAAGRLVKKLRLKKKKKRAAPE